MRTSKHASDQDLLQGVGDLLSGQINRAQLADRLGISKNLLSKRFKLAGVSDQVRKVREPSSSSFKPDPDNVIAYGKAVARAIELGNVKAAHREFPNLNYVYLAEKVRKARKAAA